MNNVMKLLSAETPRALLLSVMFLMIPTAAMAQWPSLITAPPQDSIRVTIQRSTHPVARPAYDAGAVDSGLMLRRLMLVLGPGPDEDAKLAAFSLHHRRR
jgi:hypothetical protein